MTGGDGKCSVSLEPLSQSAATQLYRKDTEVESIDALRFTSSDGWSGVLILGCHPSLLENPTYHVRGLYESLNAALEGLKRSGHLKFPS